MTGAVVADEMTGQRFEVRARAVVNAAGIWAERVTRLAGAGAGAAGRARAAAAEQGRAPGVRPGRGPDHGGAGRSSAAGDGRFVFIVPWEDRVYAGTTDTPYPGDLDHPAVDAADRDYILSAVTQELSLA